MAKFSKNKLKKSRKLAQELGNCRNPYYEGAKKICQLAYLETELSNIFLDEITVCNISLSGINEGDGTYAVNELEFPLQNKVIKYTKEKYIKLLDQFKRSITYAANEMNAKIICVNEMGMPFNTNGVVSKEAIRFAKGIAEEKECLIIAGSNHNVKNFTNSGYVFFPKKGKVALLNDKELDYLEFYKNISAFKVDEQVASPPSRIVYYTEAFGLGISFVICLEIVDYSTSAQIASKHQTVDMVLVPSYVKEQFGPMHKVAKRLSSVIGYVSLNNQYSGKGEAKSRVFRLGSIVSDDNLLIKKLDCGSILSSWTIERRNLRVDKNESRSKLSKELSCLFGVVVGTT